jgi:hypothetical protein
VAPPLGVFALVGGLFGAWKPGVARSAAGSPRAVAITLGVLAVVFLFTWGALLLTRRVAPAAVAGLLPVLAFLAYTVGPAFTDSTHVDALPEPIAAVAETTPAKVPVPAARVLTRGALAGIDHRASGGALLIRLSTGRLVVRLEGLDVEPGPDYEVHLVPGRGARPGGGTRLAHLKANRGDQNYDVPASARTTGQLSVLIWCRAFAVPVALAPLT